MLDTGIRLTHPEFGGRASAGFNFFEDGNGATDCGFHGTAAASVIGGAQYGVAKGVTLHSVRVLNCNGQGLTSWLLAGIDWVTAHHVKPAVANVSLGGLLMEASVRDAMARSINAGVFYAVAAGNDNRDACYGFGSQTPAPLVVGATSSSTIYDVRASFSNYGACVDLFAPGQDIPVAYSGSGTQGTVLSGTSMASAHVAGVAALFLASHPQATPEQVKAQILRQATPDKVSWPSSA